MKRTIEIIISSYFIIYALLYFTYRYTSFEMHPAIMLFAGIVLLIIAGAAVIQRVLNLNIFTVSIGVFTLFIMINSLL